MRYLLRWLAGLAMLGLLASLASSRDLAQSLRRVPLGVWPLAIVACLGIHALAAAKWRILMRAAGAEIAYRDAARCHASGLFGNLFLPSIVGGDVVRAGLALQLGAPRTPILLGSLVDRGLDVAALVLLAGAGAFGVPTSLDARSRSIFLALFAFAGTCAVFGLLMLLLLPARRLPFRLRRLLARSRAAARSLIRKPAHVVGAAGLAIAVQGSLVMLNVALGSHAGVQVSLWVWLLAWPLAKIAALVPVTQAGLGVREAALVALMRPFDIETAPALAAGLAFEAVLLGSGLGGGAIAWALRRRTKRDQTGDGGPADPTRAPAK